MTLTQEVLLENAPEEVDLFRGKVPLPTQERFLASDASRKAYIGPFGSGKTEVLVWQAQLLSHFYTPNYGLIGRHSYPDLRDTTRRRFMEVVNPKLVKSASIPDTGDGYVEWKCGGATIFRNLDKPEKYGSLDLGYCGIDEASEVPQKVFDFIEARIGRHWQGVPRERFPYSPVFLVGNPGGQDWIWKRFFKERRSIEDQKMYQGFQPKPRENEANLPPDYYKNLAKGKAAWWIRRFLQGDMRSLEGLVWPQFEHHANVVMPFRVPPEWRRVMGMDHGHRNPTAALWVAVDYDGNLIAYREYEVAGPTILEHARQIMIRDRKELIEYRVADPSMFNKISSGSLKKAKATDKWYSPAEEYDEYGLELQRGDNNVQASLDRVGTLLWADPAHQFPDWHPRAGRGGSPRLFIMENCERTIDEVSAWKFKEFKGEGLGLREEPVDFDDHLPDCLRYIALSFPEPSIEAKPFRQASVQEWRIRRQKIAGTAIRRAAAENDPFDDRSNRDAEYV